MTASGWTVTVDSPGAPAASAAPVPRAATPMSAAVAQQRVVIPVLPGRLSVSPAGAVVVLHRVSGNRYAGAWGPVQVIDARGSLVGWTAVIGLAGPVPGRLVVTPDAPVAVTGRPDEVVAEPSTVVTPARAAPVMAGVPGGGGGTFSVSGRVELTGGSPNGPDTMAVNLVFAVA